MTTDDDLSRRLQTAAGSQPESTSALEVVVRRARHGQRTRRAAGVVAMAVVVAAGVTAYEVERDPPTVEVHEAPTAPTTTTTPTGVRSAWRRPFSMSFAPFINVAGHRIVVDADNVYVAAGTTPGELVALDRVTGTPRWRVPAGGSLLQGATQSVVIANTYDVITAYDVRDGSTRWQLQLSTLGLSGYWPIRSTISGDLMAVGLSVMGEGPAPPPVVLGVRTETGEVVWRTTLVEGTDLDWGTPHVQGSTAVFLSTLSNPNSGTGNVAHAIDLQRGTILWRVNRGGTQAFWYRQVALDDANAYLPGVPGNPEVTAVDLFGGTRRWSKPGVVALRTAAGLWVCKLDGQLVLVDPATGAPLGPASALTGAGTAQLYELPSDRVAVVDQNTLSVVRSDGTVIRTHLDELVDEPQVVGDVLYLAFSDRVEAFRVDP